MIKMNILNVVGASDEGNPDDEMKSPDELARYLQQAMLHIKAQHISPDGRGVDYSGLASSTPFQDYIKVANKLIKCDPSSLSEDERTAFFINIYNCLTIHGLASARQLPSSVLEVNEFWKKTSYSISGMTFSLDDIEHGILRANRPHPSSDKPPFEDSDPRKALSLEKCDPRIHFALVCGAKSCPPIQVYSAKNLERGLTQATNNFCSQEVEIDVTSRKARLSKIFLWYGSDFADNEKDLLKFLSHHVSKETRDSLEKLLESEEPIDIEFKEYNWNLNKQ